MRFLTLIYILILSLFAPAALAAPKPKKPTTTEKEDAAREAAHDAAERKALTTLLVHSLQLQGVQLPSYADAATGYVDKVIEAKSAIARQVLLEASLAPTPERLAELMAHVSHTLVLLADSPNQRFVLDRIILLMSVAAINAPQSEQLEAAFRVLLTTAIDRFLAAPKCGDELVDDGMVSRYHALRAAPIERTGMTSLIARARISWSLALLRNERVQNREIGWPLMPRDFDALDLDLWIRPLVAYAETLADPARRVLVTFIASEVLVRDHSVLDDPRMLLLEPVVSELHRTGPTLQVDVVAAVLSHYHYLLIDALANRVTGAPYTDPIAILDEWASVAQTVEKGLGATEDRTVKQLLVFQRALRESYHAAEVLKQDPKDAAERRRRAKAAFETLIDERFTDLVKRVATGDFVFTEFPVDVLSRDLALDASSTRALSALKDAALAPKAPRPAAHTGTLKPFGAPRPLPSIKPLVDLVIDVLCETRVDARAFIDMSVNEVMGDVKRAADDAAVADRAVELMAKLLAAFEGLTPDEAKALAPKLVRRPATTALMPSGPANAWFVLTVCADQGSPPIVGPSLAPLYRRGAHEPHGKGCRQYALPRHLLGRDVLALTEGGRDATPVSTPSNVPFGLRCRYEPTRPIACY